MINQGALDERIYKSDKWKSQNVIIALKYFDSLRYLDVRKWVGVEGNLVPSKGIMLSVSDWKMIIKEMQSLMDQSDKELNV